MGFDLIKAFLPHEAVGTLSACISSRITTVIQVTEWYDPRNHN